MVRGIILEHDLFSVENNLLTPTFKLKRVQLQVGVGVYNCLNFHLHFPLFEHTAHAFCMTTLMSVAGGVYMGDKLMGAVPCRRSINLKLMLCTLS